MFVSTHSTDAEVGPKKKYVPPPWHTPATAIKHFFGEKKLTEAQIWKGIKGTIQVHLGLAEIMDLSDEGTLNAALHELCHAVLLKDLGKWDPAHGVGPAVGKLSPLMADINEVESLLLQKSLAVLLRIKCCLRDEYELGAVESLTYKQAVQMMVSSQDRSSFFRRTAKQLAEEIWFYGTKES